jgi:hypothetical protein
VQRRELRVTALFDQVLSRLMFETNLENLRIGLMLTKVKAKTTLTVLNHLHGSSPLGASAPSLATGSGVAAPAMT